MVWMLIYRISLLSHFYLHMYPGPRQGGANASGRHFWWKEGIANGLSWSLPPPGGGSGGGGGTFRLAQGWHFPMSGPCMYRESQNLVVAHGAGGRAPCTTRLGKADKKGSKSDWARLLGHIDTPQNLTHKELISQIFSISVHIYLIRQRNSSSHDPYIPVF